MNTLMAEHQGTSGLSHLVEAASALSELVDRQPATQTESNSPTSSEQPGQRSVVSDDDDERNKKLSTRGRRETFPQRLLAILSDDSLSEVITWLPNGRSFVIIRPDVFSETVLPKYLPPIDSRSSTKYPSFTRKLNRWGFRQITRGPDTGAFHHPLFRRDQPQLALNMVCQRGRERKAPKNVPSLPPKKRGVSSPVIKESSSQVSLEDDTTSNSVETAPDIKERLPQPSTTDTAQSALMIQRVSSVGGGALNSPISSDAKLLEVALRKREEIERIRIAQAMLYDSYLKAIRG